VQAWHYQWIWKSGIGSHWAYPYWEWTRRIMLSNEGLAEGKLRKYAICHITIVKSFSQMKNLFLLLLFTVIHFIKIIMIFSNFFLLSQKKDLLVQPLSEFLLKSLHWLFQHDLCTFMSRKFIHVFLKTLPLNFHEENRVLEVNPASQVHHIYFHWILQSVSQSNSFFNSNSSFLILLLPKENYSITASKAYIL